jgi:hypothetical protein
MALKFYFVLDIITPGGKNIPSNILPYDWLPVSLTQGKENNIL